MKFLSEKKRIYLLLVEVAFSIITVFIAAIFTNGSNADVLKSNVFYQIVSFLLSLFIYFNLSNINSELKIASYLRILKVTLNIIINLILPLLTPIIILSFSLSDVLEIIIVAFEIPFAFFFFKGFSILVSQKIKNISLANKWKKLMTASVVLSVLNLLVFINNLYGGSAFFSENLIVEFVLSFGITIIGLSLEVLKIVYIFKTAKNLI